MAKAENQTGIWGTSLNENSTTTVVAAGCADKLVHHHAPRKWLHRLFDELEMIDRRIIIILLMIGWALAIILWNMIETYERMAACVEHPTIEICCPHGECPTYKPAWDK